MKRGFFPGSGQQGVCGRPSRTPRGPQAAGETAVPTRPDPDVFRATASFRVVRQDDLPALPHG
jgi:hypothetical protein